MKVYLKINKSRPNEINKKLTLIELVEGYVTEPTSITSPTVNIAFEEKYIKCNYLEIPLFNRKYFVKSATFINGILVFECKVDVLETYKKGILEYTGTIARQEYDYNLNLEDAEISAYSSKEITRKKIGDNIFSPNIISQDTPQFVLITTSD